jgi:hypothetical protein
MSTANDANEYQLRIRSSKSEEAEEAEDPEKGEVRN